MRIWILGALAVLLGQPALAQSRVVIVNGNELHEMCQTAPQACSGYIVGVADALEATAWPAKRSCRPKTVDTNTLIELAVETLRDNPEERNRPAFDIVADAVLKAWPC